KSARGANVGLHCRAPPEDLRAILQLATTRRPGTVRRTLHAGSRRDASITTESTQDHLAEDANNQVAAPTWHSIITIESSCCGFFLERSRCRVSHLRSKSAAGVQSSVRRELAALIVGCSLASALDAGAQVPACSATPTSMTPASWQMP